MPNWCSNTITVSHEDGKQMAKFEKAMGEGNLFQTFVPLSSGEWDYGTACEEWGTKWDVNGGEFNLDEIAGDYNTGFGFFDTAWGPPIAFYEAMKELGFQITATYHEPGMAFVGQWTNEDGDESFQYDFEDEDWRDGIPEELTELLEDEYDSWLESQEEIEEE
jgi:hypothetical protein